ncbi:MAG TPA: Asp-tRNA(Asn)/Glu-tRNA(Gln) amidotransferase subunit GatB [Rectinemataceae bacterium]|nr:Asp-tRNA(Asn)/Glu-tRNA(Gln) amidotransferase subunit GatB [Rectinemataceae bacterium]
MKYTSYVGLEIHIHLLAKSKAFCSCAARFGDEPNTNVCPVCLGHPGVLPALNEEALFMGYRVARALGCELSRRTVFERKNYFYPDMPKNYQISQFAAPLGLRGGFEFEVKGETRRLAIRECHLEEDAGKLIHAGSVTLIDYNRAGFPLLEIVTEPDLKDGEEAEAYLRSFRRLVRHLGVCDGNMEEGSLRCDANVSVNEEGRGLGVKVELKNMNSSRFVRMGLDYEIRRQTARLAEGKSIQQETRLWNENRDVTETMRKKESASDYRFFPEPDLPPFEPDEAFLARVAGLAIEPPLGRKRRFVEALGLSEEQAELLVEEKSVADYFESALAQGAEARTAASWISGELRAQLLRSGQDIAASPLDPRRFASLLGALAEGRIQGTIAKQVLKAVLDEDKDPETIIAERGLEQITDKGALGAMVDEVLSREAATAERVRSGDKKALAFLVGEAMKASSGRAAAGTLKEIVMERLS